ncbi:MAG: histidine kinase [Bacteroidota bacterium]
MQKSTYIVPIIFVGGIFLILGGVSYLYIYEMDTYQSQLEEIKRLRIQDVKASSELALETMEQATQSGNKQVLAEVCYWYALNQYETESYASFQGINGLKYAEYSLSLFEELHIPDWEVRLRLLILEFALLHDADTSRVYTLFEQLEHQLPILHGTTSAYEMKGHMHRVRALAKMKHPRYESVSVREIADELDLAEAAFAHIQDSQHLFIIHRLRGSYLLNMTIQTIWQNSDTLDINRVNEMFARAEKSYLTAIHLGEVLRFDSRLNWTSIRLGELYTNWYSTTGDPQYFEKAETQFQRARQSSSDHQSRSLHNLGELYSIARDWAEDDQVTAENYHKVSIDFLRQATASALEEVNPKSLQLCHDTWTYACATWANCKGQEVNDQLFQASAKMLDAVGEQVSLAQANQFALRTDLNQRIAQQNQRTLLMAAGALIALALFIFALAYQRIKAKNLRQKLEQQLTILQVQMNPHMIGNTLNSIDSLINQNRNKEASRYLVDFSRLAYMVLTISDKKEVPLDLEIKILEKFLKLERLRLNGKMEYHLHVDPNISTRSIHLPPMLLQPFVENAIWHGIHPKITQFKERGLLSIAFLQESPDLLTCIVEDDGVGRAYVKKIKADESYRSESRVERLHAIDIISQRLQLMGHVHGAGLQTIDLYNEAGEAAGTKVILQIPIKIAHQPDGSSL